MFTLDDVIAASTNNGNPIVAENNDVNGINWVAGLNDPGEMIACGAYQELRRHNGESDDVYQRRIAPLVAKLPEEDREKIIGAAISRAKLDVHNGKVLAAFAGKSGWHNLGTVLQDVMTSTEAIRASGMDRQVTKVPLTYSFNGQTFTVKGQYALVYEDEPALTLDTVGPKYIPIQNLDAFKYLDEVIGTFGAKYESCGSLDSGRKIWVQANLPKQSFALGRAERPDRQNLYALFTNPHQYGETARCLPTWRRVECDNTLRQALNGRSRQLRIRHMGNLHEKIADAQEALNIVVRKADEYKEHAETLYRTPLDISEYADAVLDTVCALTKVELAEGPEAYAAVIEATEAEFQLKRELKIKEFEKAARRREKLLDDVIERYNSERCEPRGTAWGCLQSVTESVDHGLLGGTQRSGATGAAAEREKAERRFLSNLEGSGDEIKQTAFNLALSAAR